LETPGTVLQRNLQRVGIVKTVGEDGVRKDRLSDKYGEVIPIVCRSKHHLFGDNALRARCKAADETVPLQS
jgi:hypothetical protein